MIKRSVRYGPELRVLIVGGGVAGLALAALLEQRGFSPVIVEQATTEGGADHVIGLWPAGSRILKGIGAYTRLQEVGAECARYLVANERGEILHKYSLAPVAEKYGPVINLYRSDLAALLRNAMSDERMRCGTTVRDITQSSAAATATFSDGTTAEFDLIVGCDGVRSSVREIVFGAEPLAYSGLTGWAFSIPCSFVPPPEVVEYWGTDRFVATYPLRDRLAVRIVARAPAANPDPLESRLDRLKRLFASFGGSVPWLLGEFSRAVDVSHDDFNDIRLDQWHHGRVVLIGDAAHGSPPMNAMGAALALESAAVLAEELCRTDSDYVGAALERFEERRRPRVDHIQRRSRRLATVMFAAGRRFAWLRDGGVRLSTDSVLLDEVDGILAERI
jgi:2-polyprenyl-6-methoxyphenol hydroxylase-like FAD-dependent oxidoreductase